MGSHAILGQFPHAPAELLISQEADVFPAAHPERAELIDATIGESSPFEREFGYFAHGVGEETAVLPAGWRDRLVLVSGENTRFVKGWCLEVHDLAVAKYVAGREKDRDFTKSLVRHGMVKRSTLEERLDATRMGGQLRDLVCARMEADFASGGSSS